MIKYNLHDSLIEKVNYFSNKKRLEISIKLCNWQQPSYKDSDPEMIEILMVFEEVEKYKLSIGCYEFDSNEILDVVCMDDRTTKVVFLTENDAETLTVTADNLSFLTI